MGIAGEVLALSEMGYRDPALWRAVVRRVTRVAGEGDSRRGAVRLGDPVERRAVLAALRSSILEVCEVDPDERIVDLLHAFRREMACVAVEAAIGPGPASLLRPFRQEEVSRLPPKVLENLGLLLAERGRSVNDGDAFSRLKATAWAQALEGAGFLVTRDPRRPVATAPHRAWGRMMAEVARHLERVDVLLRILGIPLRACLVPPALGPPPVPGEIRVEAPSEPSSEERTPAIAAPGAGVSAAEAAPMRVLIRWCLRLARLVERARPYLTPQIERHLVVPV